MNNKAVTDGITDIISKWGLIGIYKTRAEMNISCDKNMKHLKNRLDIIAFGLKSFRDSKTSEILEKVKTGLRIRILTIHPESIFLKQREMDEHVNEGDIKNTIYNLIDWVNELKYIAEYSNKDKSNIEIKFYDTLPLDFYFREDDYIYTGAYVYGEKSQSTLSFEYKSDSKGYAHYTKYFKKLWNDKDFIKVLFK